MTEEVKDVSREYKTVAYVFRRCAEDTAFKAGLKKADNPDTEAQSWEYLADCGACLDRDNERLAYATVLSAIAKSDRSANGKYKLGKAIRLACGSNVSNVDNRKSAEERASRRFRRLISCGDIPEFVRVLRPLLQYINSQGIALDYANLLNCLKQISASPDRAESIKAEWAQQFYSKASEQKEENE